MLIDLHIERLTSYFQSLEICDDVVSTFLKHSETLSLSIGDSLDALEIPNDSLLFLLDGQLRHIVDLNNDSRYSTIAKYSYPFICNIEKILFGSPYDHTLFMLHRLYLSQHKRIPSI